MVKGFKTDLKVTKEAAFEAKGRAGVNLWH